MEKSSQLLLTLMVVSIQRQAVINTQAPEATLEVVGKPNDLTHSATNQFFNLVANSFS